MASMRSLGTETTKSFLAAYTPTRKIVHKERMQHEVRMQEMQHKQNMEMLHVIGAMFGGFGGGGARDGGARDGGVRDGNGNGGGI